MTNLYNSKPGLVAALILSLTITTFFAACGGSSDSADISAPAGSGNTESLSDNETAEAAPSPGEETDQYEPDSLPNDLDLGNM